MKTWIIALRIFVVLTVLTGVAYPLFVTGIAKAIWPAQAGGSLIMQGSEVKGSLLIAQKIEKDIYFHPRPSAADYNASASSGSNKGHTNADLKKIYDDGIAAHLPQDLIFSSGSGLDPHISPQCALSQVDRIAAARSLLPSQKKNLTELVNALVEGRDFGFLGEKRVNVLKLNLELDKIFAL
jgi:K+-transporting ATPase ATPase C chain